MMSTLRCGRGAQWRCLGKPSDPVQRAALCRHNTCRWLKVQLPDRTNAADRQEFVHRFAVLSLASGRGVRLKSSSRAGAEHRTTRAATRTNIPLSQRQQGSSKQSELVSTVHASTDHASTRGAAGGHGPEQGATRIIAHGGSSNESRAPWDSPAMQRKAASRQHDNAAM